MTTPRTFSTDILHGHSPRTFSTDILHGILHFPARVLVIQMVELLTGSARDPVYGTIRKFGRALIAAVAGKLGGCSTPIRWQVLLGRPRRLGESPSA